MYKALPSAVYRLHELHVKSLSDFLQFAHLQILLAVGSPVAIDMLDLEFLLGGILVCLCIDKILF